MSEALKGWAMVVLTVLFVILYMAILVGWLRPFSDITVITRLEPVIFSLIGYLFGRLPARQNEKTLKEVINRQATSSDAAHQAKERAEKEKEVIEERMRNAQIALLPCLDSQLAGISQTQIRDGINGMTTNKKHLVCDSIRTALKIMGS